MQTFFYFIGGALVVIALAVSFLGMRNESFPSTGVLRIGIVLVALVVGVTLFAAVSSSQDEAQKREDEQNQEASAEEQTVVQDNEASGVPTTGGEQAPGARDESGASGGSAGGAPVASGDAQAGSQVFADNGCGGCHSLQAAGATGAVGPNLDEALADRDTEFIQTSIVDPGAYVEKGFPDGTMPVDYGDVLTPDDLANLVAYLSESTSSGGSSAADGGSKSGGAKSGASSSGSKK